MTEHRDLHDQFAARLVAAVLDEGAALLRWLDVGLGEGAVVAAALDAGVERVDAVDPDPAAVEAAGERFDRSVVGLRIGSTHDLAGFIGPYDVVLSSLTLDVTDEAVAAMRAMRELLSYGSSAWVAVREAEDGESSGPGVAGREELAAVARDAGWTGEVRVVEEPLRALLVTTEP